VEKSELAESKAKNMLIILTSRRLFTKNSSWQDKQSILLATVTFYGDCIKMCKDFASNFGDRRTDHCITTMHDLTLPFHLVILYQKQRLLSSTYPTRLT
jgi:hypothetical protein